MQKCKEINSAMRANPSGIKQEKYVSVPDMNTLNEDLEIFNNFLNDDVYFSSPESGSNVNDIAISSQNSNDMQCSSQEKMVMSSQEMVTDNRLNISEFNELKEGTSSSISQTNGISEETSNNSRGGSNQSSCSNNQSNGFTNQVSTVAQIVLPQNASTGISFRQDKCAKCKRDVSRTSSEDSLYSMESLSQGTVIMSSLESNNILEPLQKDINSSSDVIDNLKSETGISYCELYLSRQDNFDNNGIARNTNLFINNLQVKCPVTIDGKTYSETKTLSQNNANSQVMEIASQESLGSHKMETSSQETVVMCEDEIAVDVDKRNQAESLQLDEGSVYVPPSKKFCKKIPKGRERFMSIRRREIAVLKKEKALQNRENKLNEREAALLKVEKLLSTREQNFLKYEEALFSNI